MEGNNFAYVKKLLDIVAEELLKTDKKEATDVENLVVALNDLTIFVEL